MNSSSRAPRQGRPPAQPATYVVKFEQRPGLAPQSAQSAPAGRVPRVARLLALAHRIDGMIRSGEIRDWAEAARVVGITRARMTQIANLLLVGPQIQDAILSLAPASLGFDSTTEHGLRPVCALPEWEDQRVRWNHDTL